MSGVGVAVLGVWVVVMGQGSGAVGFGCLVLFGFLSFAVLVVLPPDFLDFDGYVMYELLGKVFFFFFFFFFFFWLWMYLHCVCM